MAVFQISSRSAQMTLVPSKRAGRFSSQWYEIAKVLGSIVSSLFIGGAIIAPLMMFRQSDLAFLLLPGVTSLVWAQPLRYQLGKFLHSRLLFILLTVCFTLFYYAAISGWQLFIHRGGVDSHILLITTAIAGTILFEPVRLFVQTFLERRFNKRTSDASRAIESFTITLREEIHLDQLRERFLTLIQQTMQPYSLSLWIRSTNQQPPMVTDNLIILADDDELIGCALRYPDVLDVELLHIDSPALRDLRLQGAEILLPLATQGELVGLLILGPHLKGERYSREERNMLDSLAPQVAPALRVAQLVQEQQMQVRERERIEQELRTAQGIQRAFLPKEVPTLSGWQLAPYYQPAREVGGDFYDFMAFADGRWGLVIGDVTGKGVPAALVMATVHTMLRTTARDLSSPGKILARANELLASDIPAGMFVTCFFALLNPQSGHLCYANAGHELPYRQRNGEASELWATGMPLGLMEGTQYEEHEITLAPGENLFFYSDGLVEAHNPEREMLGFPRLASLVNSYQEDSGLIDFLLTELTCFTGSDWEQEDDVTMLFLRRNSL